MFKELDTQHYLLQEIKADDQAFIFEGLSHSEVIAYYGVSYKTFEDTKLQMDFYRTIQESGTGAYWKIVAKENLNKLGVIGFNNYQKQHGRAEIGYWLLPEYWGRGIIAEVLAMIIDFMLHEKKIHRIEASVEKGNTASERVLKRMGFTYEGCLRDCEIKNGNYISLSIYSLLATDV